MSHSPLLVAYLHCIGWWDSTSCPHCNGADEMAEHLVLHCPSHDQARWESWPNLHYQSNLRRLWSFLQPDFPAASDRSKNAYRTCQASILRRCSCSMEQSAGQRHWRKQFTIVQKTFKNLSIPMRLPHVSFCQAPLNLREHIALHKSWFDWLKMAS